MKVSDDLEIENYTEIESVKKLIKKIVEQDEDQDLYESYYKNFFESLPEKYKPKDIDFEDDTVGSVMKAGKKLNALRKMKTKKIKDEIAEAINISIKEKTHSRTIIYDVDFETVWKQKQDQMKK